MTVSTESVIMVVGVGTYKPSFVTVVVGLLTQAEETDSDTPTSSHEKRERERKRGGLTEDNVDVPLCL